MVTDLSQRHQYEQLCTVATQGLGLGLGLGPVGTQGPAHMSSAVLEPRMPSLSSLTPVEKPGKSLSTMKAVICCKTIG